MNDIILSKLIATRFNSKKTDRLPTTKSVPISPSEKSIREELDRLNQSIEELRRIREEINRKKT